MTRALIVLGVIAALALGAWWMGWSGAKQDARTDRLQDTLDSAETYNEESADPADCGWHDWLLDACPD